MNDSVKGVWKMKLYICITSFQREDLWVRITMDTKQPFAKYFLCFILYIDVYRWSRAALKHNYIQQQARKLGCFDYIGSITII